MIEQIKHDIDDYNSGKCANLSNKRFVQSLTFLLKQNEQMKQALQFYADETNWKTRKRCGNCGHHSEEDLVEDSAEWEQGFKAREALKVGEPNEPI